MSEGVKKILYYQCFSGISGDMNLAALIDVGVPAEKILEGLERLELSNVKVHIEEAASHAIHGTRVRVEVTHPTHAVRRLREVHEIIDEAGLPQAVTEMAKKIFGILAEAEAKVHRSTPERVHFHEVGGEDALIDIVGAALAWHHLGVDEVWASTVEAGGGTVKSAHGILPVPAPATAEIMRGRPIQVGGAPFETLTPTGAAILAATVQQWTDTPEMTLTATGYGIGHRECRKIPNLLRVFLGEVKTPLPSDGAAEELVCTIDDMDPQWYEWLMEKLFEKGAQDVTFTPVIMKKGRPATQVTILSSPERAADLGRLLLTETTTIGYRTRRVGKIALQRGTRRVETPLGPVRIKESFLDGKRITRKVEYEDCRTIAAEQGLPLRQVCEEINKYLERHDPA